MSGIDVALTGEQLTFAEDVGERRNRWAAENNLQPKWGQRAEDAPEHRMNGTVGEFAFAIVLGRADDWPETSPDEPPAATDFAGCEVRTRLREWYELTIHPESPDDVPHILVTGLRPVFVVQGWVYGREGKLPGYWQEYVPGRPCFFVPHSALRSVPDRRPKHRCPDCGRPFPDPDYPYVRCLKCELARPAEPIANERSPGSGPTSAI